MARDPQMSCNPTSKTAFRLTKYLLNSESDADDCTLTRGKSIQEAGRLENAMVMVFAFVRNPSVDGPWGFLEAGTGR
jgi:hypothetical protein